MGCGFCGPKTSTARYVCTKCGKVETREVKEGEEVRSCCGELMVKKEEYIDKLAKQLKEWGAQIDTLKAKAGVKAGKEGAEIKKALGEDLNKLNAMMKDAQKKLQDIKGKSGDAWKSLAQGTNKAWADLREGVHQAAEKFK